MKHTFFDNIRWGELTGWLTGLSGVLAALVQTPLPDQYKSWIMVAISVIAFLMAFLRNPKSLDWIDEAQEIPVAYRKAVSPKVTSRAAELRRQLEELEDAIDTPSRGTE